ncbi:MAG: PTS sugar transporter subunit IIA [Calditrichaeota bacterium]|nr:PTS sugar transporter subunit IIA [Calditrichota bacterium]RQV92937.1 MAG: PTS sugar transporter subunit IIA [bacterium]RQW07984.1 MAG: PTS sugar transporter subunit IIA [Calditrichota bacterium]
MKLVDVIQPKSIKIPLQSSTKESIIRELIQVLEKQNLFNDPEDVFKAVMERERIMTTGVGREVAIPHCKKQECNQFAIALGIHPGGIDFNSIDNKPVKIFFLLLGPEENPGMHIRLLSRISRLIAKDSLRQGLLNASGPQEAYELLKAEEEKYFEIVS